MVTDDDSGIDKKSKSQVKRELKALQDLGKKLAGYNQEQLAKIPLNEQLLEAIRLAHKIANKRGALKRHFQYIGKLLRNLDPTPIIQAVELIEQADRQNRQRFKRLEQWRERILAEGDPAINQLCQESPQMDRQKLRQLARNHQAATEQHKVKFARQLFKELSERLD